MTLGRRGKYDLVTRLASGGMAEIFVARSSEDPARVVVLKQMLPQYLYEPGYVEMFLDEGRTISLLRHPNIVRMYDFGFQGEVPYLAMEYLHGADVRTIMRMARRQGQVVPLPIALTIVAAVCAGLHCTHSARSLDGYAMDIVHRDVSPQNVVVTFEGGIKLIDFGIAKSRGRIHETRAGALKGKIPYMAPEQVRGGETDRRSDLYAAGVLLYELTTGRRPYIIEQGDEPMSEFSLMMAIVAHKIARPSAVRPGLPIAIEQVILKALAAAPAERFQTAEVMQQAVESAARAHGLAIDPRPIPGFLRQLFGSHALQGRSGAGEELASEIDALEQLRTQAGEQLDPAGIAAAELAAEPAQERARADFADPTSIAAPPPIAPGEVSIVKLEPRIDERFRGAERAGALAGAVIFDLGQVERISSFGVREWLELHRALDARPDGVALYLARCSEAVINQLGMIRSFLGRGQLVSLQAPYQCTRCSHTFQHGFDCERDAAALGQPVAPVVACPACGAPAQLDDDPAYFAPVRPQLGRPVPPDVRAALDGLEAAAQPSREVEKHVGGQLTKLRFLRQVDRGFRWGRLLDGLEGSVELDVTAARLDGAGIDGFAAALHGLGAEVRAVRVFGAPPALVARLERTPRCEVHSVAVDGRCPRCALRRTSLISPAELRTLVAGGPVVVSCRRCDTPLDELDVAVARPAPTPDRAGSPPRRRWLVAGSTAVGAIAAGAVALSWAQVPTPAPTGSRMSAVRTTAAQVPADAAVRPAVRADAPPEREVAEASGTGEDPAAALGQARLRATRQLIARIEQRIAPALRALGDPATPDEDVVAHFTAQLGSRIAITRLSATPGPERTLVVRYAISRDDLEAATAFYAARAAAFGATLANAPPTLVPGVVVLRSTRDHLRAGDRVLSVDGMALQSLAAFDPGVPARPASTLVIERGGVRSTIEIQRAPPHPEP